MERTQFTFYRSYYEAVKGLSKRDQTAVFLAVCAYALDGEEPKLSGVAQSIFALIRPTLDTGRNKAQNRLKAKTKEEQTENKPETNGEQSVKEKEREKEREKDIYKENEVTDVTSQKKAPAAMELPLNDGAGYAVSMEQVAEWEGLYPAVDVMQQLRNMRGWLLANAERRKTRNGILRFITGWLAKEQDRGGGRKQEGKRGNLFAELVKEGALE